MIATPPQPVSGITDEEFEQRTLDLIQREFGLGGLARFIMTFRSGKGDYTAERHQWLDGLKVDDILSDIGLSANQSVTKK